MVLDELEQKLKQRERAQEFRRAVKGARKEAFNYALYEKKKPYTIIELLVIGDYCILEPSYQYASKAYCEAIRKTTSPEEPQVTTHSEEKQMAITRLERLVKKIMSDKSLSDYDQKHIDDAYKGAKAAIEALKYFQQ